MLNQVLISIRSIILSALFTGSVLWGNSSNPPNGYHGESQNCASCHGGNLNSGDGSISLSGLPTTYLPGQTYSLTLTVLGTNSRGFGFQLSPKVNGASSGTLSGVKSGMAIESGAAEHQGASLSGVWDFQWTAPATDEGTVTFYASGLATGGTSGNDGDYVYTLSQDISASPFPHASMDWNASTGGVIFSSPAIGGDGSTYIGSNDNKLHAFNSDGSPKWTFTAGNWIDSTPAVGSDETIYIGSWDNKIYAINSENGIKIWEYETNSYVIASPAIGADGKIYVGSKDSIFYAFESNGSVAWEYFAGQPISSSAALGQDGTIYFGDENGTFHAVNPDGTAKWTYEVEDVADTNKSILSSPAIDLSGNIYFGSGNGNCYSLSDNETNASFNWSFPTSDRVDASPVLGTNDEVFFVSRDGYLRSLSTLTGNLNWDAFVGDVFYSSPVVDQNGTTYVIGYTGGGENHLFAYDSNGTKVWDTNDTACPFKIGGIVDSSLALSLDGKLYYGCYDNRIYCIDVGLPPASSDWPMFQRSAKRDGAWPSYHLETSVSPMGVAIISGDGIYNEGATATISIVSTIGGYSFSHWSGASSGNEHPLNLTIDSDLSVAANFAINQYLLTVNSGIGGTVSESGNFAHGDVATISATPDDGYIFAGWSGTGIADPNSAETTVEMNETKTVSASFSLNQYSLTLLAGEGGTVNGEGNFSYGSNATIHATPETGYSFAGWSGEGVQNQSTTTTTVTMTQARTITAFFTVEDYSLLLNATTGGTVTGDGNYTHGQIIAITALPESGYQFDEWSGDIDGNLSSPSRSIIMDSNKSITANFIPVTENNFVLSIVAIPEIGGSTTGAGSYLSNTVVPITANPLQGYEFLSWEGLGIVESNVSSTSVNLSQNLLITANFRTISFYLQTNSVQGGTVTGSGTYEYGLDANISATADEGYSFGGWQGEGVANPASPNTTIVITEDRNVTAVFSRNIYNLKVNASAGGTVSGGGNFYYGHQASISAFPNSGYKFDGWDGGAIANPLYRFTTVNLISDLNLTAIFSLIPIAQKLEGIHEIAPDWYDSSWFGSFFQNEGGWAYQMEFGWIFPIVQDSENIWFWSEELGWIWANLETFSQKFLWIQEDENWIYWDNTNPATIRYFNYSTAEWIQWLR